MPNEIKFLDSIIRNIEPSQKRQNYWCMGCPGFGLRVTKTGAKTFIFKYMAASGANKRVSRWRTIGKYPEWSIRQARRVYDRLYEQVHEYGRDPVAEIQAEKKKKQESNTVAEFVEIYLEYAKLRGKVSIREEERVFRLDVLPLMGDKKVHEVTPDEIDEMQAHTQTGAALAKRYPQWPSGCQKLAGLYPPPLQLRQEKALN